MSDIPAKLGSLVITDLPKWIAVPGHAQPAPFWLAPGMFPGVELRMAGLDASRCVGRPHAEPHVHDRPEIYVAASEERGTVLVRIEMDGETFNKVVEVIGEMAGEAHPAHRLITIIMTGGSILRKVQRGPDNATDFNIPYIEAIRERIGRRIPIVMITESQPMEDVTRLRDAGVTVHNANLEVWDERLFGIVAPGKQKYVGYDTWVRRLLEAVDIMGEGNVTPNMVSGIEMAQPWGFDRVDDAVKSAHEGFEFLMSRGVIPHLDTWCIEPGSPLEGHPPVPLDFLIRADIAWYETWRKYNLPPFAGYGPMGAPGIAVYGNTASVDMGD